MRRKKSKSFQTKILISYLLLVCLFVCFILFNYSMNKKTQDLSDKMFKQQEKLSTLQNINRLAYSIDDYQVKLIHTEELESKNMLKKKTEESIKQIHNDNKSLKKSALGEKDLIDIRNFEEDFEMYINVITKNINDSVNGIAVSSNSYLNTPFEDVTTSLHSFGDRQKERIDTYQKQLDSNKEFSQNISIVFTLFVLIVSIGMSLYLPKKTTKSIIQVNSRLKELSESQGDLTVRLPVKSNDEVGELSHSFNLMIENLQNLVSKIDEKAEEVTKHSSMLNVNSKQTTEAINYITDGAKNIANEIEKQFGNAQKSSDRTEETINSIKEIAVISNNVYTSSSEMNEEAEKGSILIDRVIHQMNSITESANNTAEVIKNLSNLTQEIGSIVEILTQISEQTNLLSLNASIEAARAGEHGKGFGVVAEEVKKLAVNSKEHSSQISQIVHSIEKYTQLAITAIEKESKEVKSGIAAVEEVQNAFKKISDSTNDISQEISTLTHSSEDIMQSAQTVLETSERNLHSLEETSSASVQISEMVDRQKESMMVILKSTDELNQMAVQLKRLIDQFTI